MRPVFCKNCKWLRLQTYRDGGYGQCLAIDGSKLYRSTWYDYQLSDDPSIRPSSRNLHNDCKDFRPTLLYRIKMLFKQDK